MTMDNFAACCCSHYVVVVRNVIVFKIMTLTVLFKAFNRKEQSMHKNT